MKSYIKKVWKLFHKWSWQRYLITATVDELRGARRLLTDSLDQIDATIRVKEIREVQNGTQR